MAGSQAAHSIAGWRTACACCVTMWRGSYRQPCDSLAVLWLLLALTVLLISTGVLFGCRVQAAVGSSPS
jgi:hypothetical protein